MTSTAKLLRGKLEVLLREANTLAAKGDRRRVRTFGRRRLTFDEVLRLRELMTQVDAYRSMIRDLERLDQFWASPTLRTTTGVLPS